MVWSKNSGVGQLIPSGQVVRLIGLIAPEVAIRRCSQAFVHQPRVQTCRNCALVQVRRPLGSPMSVFATDAQLNASRFS